MSTDLPPTVTPGSPAPAGGPQPPHGMQDLGTGGVPNLQQYPADDLTKDLVLATAPRMDIAGRSTPALGGIPLLRRLGQGGMGAVYYGIHPRLEHEVAVKVLPLNVVALRPELIDRFFREARIAARIKSPYLVSVQDVNQEGSLLYLVMDYVKGVSAGGYIKRQSEAKAAIPESQALDICIAATEGLAEAHRNGIVHRDIKPDNILIPDGPDSAPRFELAKLADLGIARGEESGSTLTATAATMGTPGFMSPEQAMDAKTAGKPADIFSMGATLYALLSGRAPFADTSVMKTLMATANKPHEPIRKLRGDVSEAAARLIDRCLQKNPAKRFTDAGDLLQALRECRNAPAATTTLAKTLVPIVQDPIRTPERKATLMRAERSASAELRPASPPAGQRDHAPSPPTRPSAGLAVLGIMFGLLVLLVLASGAGYYYWQKRQEKSANKDPDDSKKAKTPETPAVPAASSTLMVDMDSHGNLSVNNRGLEGLSLAQAEERLLGRTRTANEPSPIRVHLSMSSKAEARLATQALAICARLNIPKVTLQVSGYKEVLADLPGASEMKPTALRFVIDIPEIEPGETPVYRILGTNTETRSVNASKIASHAGPDDEVHVEIFPPKGNKPAITVGPVVDLLEQLHNRGVTRIGFVPSRPSDAWTVKVTTAKGEPDVVVPPDILDIAELGDHNEIAKTDRPDEKSAFGNPDAHMFHGVGEDDAAGGGGVSLDDAIGVGGGSGGGHGSFGARGGGGRRLMVMRHGGSRETEAAVDAALKWLAGHQEVDGHWDSVKHGGKKADVAVTGLALLAFLGSGHTEKVGAYKDNVKRAVDWLISIQTVNGKIYKEGETQGIGYHHGIAGLALAEAAGMGRVAETVKAAQKAIDYSTEIHQQGEGNDKLGWSYGAKEKGDLSVSTWFILQLKAAKVAGLHVNPASFDGAIKFLDTVEERGDPNDPASGNRYGYQKPGHAHQSTAMGCLCRQFLGWKREDLKGGVEFFIQQGGLPAWGINGATTDLNYWYYGSLCAFQQGGDLWKKWNEALKPALCKNQRKGGDEDGSWDLVGAYAENWGRVGQTAVAALCLETYYRYLPLYK